MCVQPVCAHASMLVPPVVVFGVASEYHTYVSLGCIMQLETKANHYATTTALIHPVAVYEFLAGGQAGSRQTTGSH